MAHKYAISLSKLTYAIVNTQLIRPVVLRFQSQFLFLLLAESRLKSYNNRVKSKFLGLLTSNTVYI